MSRARPPAEEEQARADARRRSGEDRVPQSRPGVWPGVVAPAATGLLALGLWEWIVRARDIPPYILPGPVLIARTLVEDWPVLAPSLVVTLTIALKALALAAVGGVALAVLLSQSRWLGRSLLPYAIVLQVTPVVAIAPLIIVWVDDVGSALLICAWLVAFFPILANTMVGLISADRNLVDLFRLYRASRWQTMLYLRCPAALPYFLAGLRISGGLALIGAVVAEFVAGAGGSASGLAYRIMESGYQLRIPRMFAALILISFSGVAIFAATSLLSRLLLMRWHDSEIRRER